MARLALLFSLFLRGSAALAPALVGGDNLTGSDETVQVVDKADLPFCCMSYVHIGKTAGTTFEEAFSKKHVVNATTFHHPYSYFADHGLLQPECLIGTTLRHPVSLFESRYWWCRDQKCERKHQPRISCGFLFCDKGSYVDKVYSRHRGTYKTFLENPEDWPVGRNIQTRFLGPQHGEQISLTAEIVNATDSDAGLETLAHAKKHLDAFDVVLMYETLEESYENILGIKLPSVKRMSSKHRGNARGRRRLTESEGHRVEDLNQLDLDLWEHGMDVNKRQRERGPDALRENTRVVDVPGSGGKRQCLEPVR